MSCTCGCCAGITPRTPLDAANRPGLEALARRAGTHPDFLESMLVALSGDRYPALADLRTREAGDPSIALLDAGAMLLDVLSFYQERIANEGYLRTATERRSILELARLVGYRLRPGVAASAWLAYTLEAGHRVTLPKGSKAQSAPGPGELPQTFETSGDLEARAEWNDLKPRQTQPQTRASILQQSKPRVERHARVFLKGVVTRLNAEDRMLIDFGQDLIVPFRVTRLDPDTDRDRTAVFLEPLWITPLVETVQSFLEGLRNLGTLKPPELNEAVGKALDTLGRQIEDHPKEPEVVTAVQAALKRLGEIQDKFAGVPNAEVAFVDAVVRVLGSLLAAATARAEGARETMRAGDAHSSSPSLIDLLTLRRSIPPRRLARSLSTANGSADLALRAIAALRPVLRDSLPVALRNQFSETPQEIRVFALRTKVAPFGHNASREPKFEEKVLSDSSANPRAGLLLSQAVWREWELAPDESVGFGVRLPLAHVSSSMFLEQDQAAIAGGSYALVTSDYAPQPAVMKINRTKSLARNAYGLTGKSLWLEFDRPWLVAADTRAEAGPFEPLSLDILRKTVVYARSEELTLAEEPIDECLGGGTAHPLELAGLFSEMPTGRMLIVAGERADIPGVRGIPGTELVMVAGVGHKVVENLPGDKQHTFLQLAEPLQYCYVRETVKIYGNVVDATHGESREESLGGGDGAQAFQRFNLKAKPVTFTAAPTAEGAASTLDVLVNDVRWHERGSLADQKAGARVFTTRTDDDAKTVVTFGDGINGARLPTGIENVRALYRSGIGRAGNVRAQQLTTLTSKPLGVKEVVNPLPASGGADADTRDRARRLVPVSVQALDRLISISDYADFSRAFAGIGKAAATKLSDGHREVVHVTIAGVEDAPILPSSDLFRNLSTALQELGDPFQPVMLEVRDLVLLVISARIRIDADYVWEKVEPRIRTALLDAFGFEGRELGDPATSSQVLAVIQSVGGVSFADLEAFGGVHEWRVDEGRPPSRRLIALDEIAADITQIVNSAGATSTDCPWPRRFCPVRAAKARWEPGLGQVVPAELAILSPDVPDTLILNLA